MKIKYLIMFLPILMCSSLFSIGFASWIIGNSPEVVTGTIGTDEVFSTNAYLELTNIDNLEFCSEGYVYNNNISSTGVMTLHYKLKNLNYFNERFDGLYDSIKLELKLTFNSETYNIFETTNNQSSTHLVTSDFIRVSEKFPTGKPNNQYFLELTFNYLNAIEEDYYYFSISYYFNNSVSDFSSIYTELQSAGNNAFTIDTKIYGYRSVTMSGGGDS